MLNTSVPHTQMLTLLNLQRLISRLLRSAQNENSFHRILKQISSDEYMYMQQGAIYES